MYDLIGSNSAGRKTDVMMADLAAVEVVDIRIVTAVVCIVVAGFVAIAERRFSQGKSLDCILADCMAVDSWER